MKKHKLFIIKLAVLAVTASIAAAAGAAAAISVRQPEVSAACAVLHDRLSGEFYYKKDSARRMPMASTTKIMTALTAIQNCDISRTAEVSAAAAAVEGSRMYLRQGEKISVEDLLYGLMLSSGNDAAIAIAEHISGGTDEFAALMNRNAAKLGLTDTHFETVNGLDGQNHYTTAEELAIITDNALKNPKFRQIVSTKRYKTATGEHYLTNHNKLLHMYEYATGVKTGFTKKSGRCLVSSALKDGRELIAVTLNAPDDWNDHMRLLDYGFSRLSKKYELKAGDTVSKIPLIGMGKIELLAEEGAQISLTSEEMRQMKTEIIGKRFVYPPVNEGDIYGELVLSCRGTEYLRVNLVYGKS